VYAAELGRFLTRDPIRFVDGYSLYQATFVPNDTDPSGKLRFSNNGPQFKKCGGLKHTVHFILDEGERNGIILQRVCYQDVVLRCKGKGEPECVFPQYNCPNTIKTCASQCYLEYWEVERGESLVDRFAFPICKASWGTRIQIGAAVFIPEEWRLQHQELFVSFGTGDKGVGRACSLMSACFDASRVSDLWDQAFAAFGGKGTSRASFTAWDCCCSLADNALEWSWATPN
jgi:hypothetical protein